MENGGIRLCRIIQYAQCAFRNFPFSILNSQLFMKE